MFIIYMAYYTQHGTECYKKINLQYLLHKLCHRALVVGRGGCGGVVDTVDAAAATTVAADKLALLLAAGSLACLFSSNCTDECTILMCLCRLFVEPAA